MKAQIITKEAFKGVGYMKTVTFEEAQAKTLHRIILDLMNKVHDIPNVVNLEGLWALSHPVSDTGFTFYILTEVSDYPDELQANMITHEVPALTYAKCHHEKGQSINQSYTDLFKWIEENGYKLNQNEVTHLEWYPLTQDLNNPHFDILIPVFVD